jgi:hypothetical protein
MLLSTIITIFYPRSGNLCIIFDSILENAINEVKCYGFPLEES